MLVWHVPKLGFRFQALLGSRWQGAVPFPKRFRGGGGLYQVRAFPHNQQVAIWLGKPCVLPPLDGFLPKKIPGFLTSFYTSPIFLKVCFPLEMRHITQIPVSNTSFWSSHPSCKPHSDTTPLQLRSLHGTRGLSVKVEICVILQFRLQRCCFCWPGRFGCRLILSSMLSIPTTLFCIACRHWRKMTSYGSITSYL
jgi:hypothetical protein